ncbi:Bud site selection protein bud4 [Malassezia brasiliensis]|uniref:Bud site selection protein bud4 n=1 Tax=Malassezia brasiliensis TaxID=1821822 RepID=A0AAF0DV00_9BASI|nr:Bud site selection protein bud4 [Malassezia brasiliensis]
MGTNESNSGLGLGIVVEDVPEPSPARYAGAGDVPASELRSVKPPFRRPGMLPSLATRDRLVIDDVLEQYSPPKPGDESWSAADASIDFDVSRDSQVAPAIIDAYVRMPRAGGSASFLQDIPRREAAIPETPEEPQARGDQRRGAMAPAAYDTPIPSREAPPIPTAVSGAVHNMAQSTAPTAVDTLLDESFEGRAPSPTTLARADSGAPSVPRVSLTYVQDTEEPETHTHTTTVVTESYAPGLPVTTVVGPSSTPGDSGSEMSANVDRMLERPLEALPSAEPDAVSSDVVPPVDRSATSASAPSPVPASTPSPVPAPAPALAAPAMSYGGLAPPITSTSDAASLGLGAASARDEPSFDETQRTVLERPDVSYERQDTSSLMAAERVENLVDALLQDEFLAPPDERHTPPAEVPHTAEAAAPVPDVHMVTSPSIRRLDHAESASPPAPPPAPKLASPDLPKLPSWSPITLEGLLPVESSPPRKAVEMPVRTVRPHITRDAVRQRMDRRRQGLPVERTPELPHAEPEAREVAAEAPAAPVAEPAGPSYTRPAPSTAPTPTAKASKRATSRHDGPAPPLRVHVAPLRELGPVSKTRASLDERRSLASPLTQIESDLKRRASESARGPRTEAASAPVAAGTASVPPEIARQSSWFEEHSAEVEARATSPTSAASPTEFHSTDGGEEGAAEGAPTVEAEAAAPAAPAEAEAAAPAPPAEEGPFSHFLERELSRIVTESDQKYRVYNRGVFQSNSPELAQRPTFAMHAVDERPWQKLRKPNEVNAFRRVSGNDAPPPAPPGEMTTGRTFVLIDAFIPSALPLPKEPTSFYCVLDNGIHMVKTASSDLRAGPDGLCPIQQEFELVEHPDLELSFTLLLDHADHLVESVPEDGMIGARTAHGAPRTGVGRLLHPFSTRTAGTSRGRFLSRVRVPTMLHYTNRQGALGRSMVSLDAVKGKCFARSLLLDVPVRPVGDDAASGTQAGGMSAERHRAFTANLTKPRGTLRLRLFYLPPLPISMQDELPKNLAECELSMNNLAWHRSGTTYKGTLTQLGGDCKTWRRRPMRIMGLNLICFNEVTKRPTTRIDLMQALVVEDCASLGADLEDMDEMLPEKRSFRIVFHDGEKIYFFADTDAEMRQWLRALQTIVAHKLDMPPAWAQAAYAAANEFHGLPQPSTKSAAATATSTVRAAVADDQAPGARMPPPRSQAGRAPPRPRTTVSETAEASRPSPPTPGSAPRMRAPRPPTGTDGRTPRKPAPTAPRASASAAASRAPTSQGPAAAPRAPTPQGPASTTPTTTPPLPRPSTALQETRQPTADAPEPARPKGKSAPMAKARQFFSRHSESQTSPRWSLNFAHTKPLRPF